MTVRLLSMLSQWNNRLTYAALAVILIGVILRFVALENDPPLSMTGHGQALLTDPYHLTHHARNDALFGEWRSFGNTRWDTFKNSLVSGTAYLVFSVAGVSRVAANLAALLLNLAGLALFVAAIYLVRGMTEALLTAILLSLNNLLFVYGRLPFLENGLIFLSGAAFFVLIYWGDKISGQIFVGALIALAALAGKLFGALLLAPALITLLYIYRKRIALPALALLGGFVAGGALYLIVFYGFDIKTALAYYTEHTVGMYGTPPGFKSISSFFKMLFTYGGESGYVEFSPLAVLFGFLALIFLPLYAPKNLRKDPKFAPALFCAVWALVGFTALSPFLYRPIRYGLFFLLPLSALGAAALAEAFRQSKQVSSFHPWWPLPVVFLISAYLTTQAVMFFAEKGGRFAAGVGAFGVSLFIGAVVTAVYWGLFCRKRQFKYTSAISSILLVTFLATSIWGAQRIYNAIAHSGKQLRSYNTEIAEILPENAVLTGPYAPALTIDNNLRSVIYMFGLAQVELDLFKKYPITHMAVDRSNWEKAQGIYPELSGAKFLTAMVVRDVTIHLYRISANTDSLTSFEQGMAYLETGFADSAEASFRKALDEHPHNSLAWMNLISVLPARGAFEEVDNELQKLLAAHPDNYQVVGFAYGMYSRVAKHLQNEELKQKAQALKQKLDRLNPAMPEIITDG